MADITELRGVKDMVGDPKIIKIAKLGLLIADRELDDLTKLGYIKLALKQGTISEDDAIILMAYRADLVDFATED